MPRNLLRCEPISTTPTHHIAVWLYFKVPPLMCARRSFNLAMWWTYLRRHSSWYGNDKPKLSCNMLRKFQVRGCWTPCCLILLPGIMGFGLWALGFVQWRASAANSFITCNEEANPPRWISIKETTGVATVFPLLLYRYLTNFIFDTSSLLQQMEEVPERRTLIARPRRFQAVSVVRRMICQMPCPLPNLGEILHPFDWLRP